jgi:hypothetical protein
MHENHDLQDEYFNFEGYTEKLEGVITLIRRDGK